MYYRINHKGLKQISAAYTQTTRRDNPCAVDYIAKGLTARTDFQERMGRGGVQEFVTTDTAVPVHVRLLPQIHCDKA